MNRKRSDPANTLMQNSDPVHIFEKANLLLALRCHDEALALLLGCYELNQETPIIPEGELCYQIALAYEGIGRLSEARSYYEESRMLHVAIAKHWENIRKLKKNGNYQEALKELLILKELAPMSTEIGEELLSLRNKVQSQF